MSTGNHMVGVVRRQTIIALLNYLSQKPSPAMAHWKKDVEAAHLLLGAVEGDGV